MNRTGKSHTIDSLFSFLLLLAFLLFSLLLIGTGSAIYKKVAAGLDENYTSRTAIAYVSEKVRQHDSAGDLFLTSFGEGNTVSAEGVPETEIPALCLRDIINEKTYLTYVYYYDGALRELMVGEATSPDASMGSEIAELSACTIELAGETGSDLSEDSDGAPDNDSAPGGRLLRVTTVSTGGKTLSVLIHATDVTVQ